MFGRDRIFAKFGMSDNQKGVRDLFLDFAMEMDEILPDGDSKVYFLTSLAESMKYALGSLEQDKSKISVLSKINPTVDANADVAAVDASYESLPKDNSGRLSGFEYQAPMNETKSEFLGDEGRFSGFEYKAEGPSPKDLIRGVVFGEDVAD